MTNLDRLKDAYTAWDATKGASLDVWHELLADEIVFHHIDGSSHPGLAFAKDSLSKDEAMAYLAGLFEQWTMVHYTPEHYVSEGDKIALFGTCCFEHKVTRNHADCRIATLVEFSGDKIVGMTEIFDSAKAAIAATPKA